MKTILVTSSAGIASIAFVFFVACGSSSDNNTFASGSSDGSAAGVSSSGSAAGPPGVGVPGPGATHAGCRIFPADNAWNTDISAVPVDDAKMKTIMPGMALSTGVHPDWGSASDNYGIPITVGTPSTPVPLTFNTSYGPTESDKLPCTSGVGDFCYPIPLDAKIEGGPSASSDSDRHVLFLATDTTGPCRVYELYNTQNQSGAGFECGGAAIFHLESNELRPEGFSSADAAGLSILAGLVRREEVERGEILHAIRFTMGKTQNGYIHPATHAAGDKDASLPPMGLRVRLKASFAEAGFSGPALYIVRAMKRFGMILADNGSNWYISGETNQLWAPDMDALLTQLKKVTGADFEIVTTGDIIPQPE